MNHIRCLLSFSLIRSAISLVPRLFCVGGEEPEDEASQLSAVYEALVPMFTLFFLMTSYFVFCPD